MKAKHRHIAAALLCMPAFLSSMACAVEPLPSWRNGKANQAIIGFVEKVTKEESPDFIPPADRIATFDKIWLFPHIDLVN